MNAINLTVKIESIHDHKIGCNISNEKQSVFLNYFPNDGNLIFEEESKLAKVVMRNKIQFEKVIRSAINGNPHIGQTINCVFIEGFNFLKDTDFTKYICVDRRHGNINISLNKAGSVKIHKIYSDGSFSEIVGQSGYGGFIETPNGKRQVYTRSFSEGSSNLMELLAVIEGIKILYDVENIQINTDSRYVIRGLAQWIHFWRLNDWQTAYGRKVKYTKHWQEIYQLCENKMIELKWIKGHSGNKEQSFCHNLARSTIS